MSTASLIAAMPAATCAISFSSGPAHGRDDAELRGAGLRRLLGRLDEHRDVQPRRPYRRREQARLAAEVAVLRAPAGLQRDDPLDLDLRPAPPHPHLVGELQQRVQRLVGQPQHLENLRFRQPFTPLEDLVAGRCRGSRTWSSSRLGSLPCAAESRGQSVTRETGERGRDRAHPHRRRRRPRSGTPVTAGRSTRLQRAARSGSAGHAPMTTPRQFSPRRRSSATVSSVWLSVPSPAAATTSTGAASFAATSASVPPSSSKRTSRPPAPSMSTRSWSAGELQRGRGRGLGTDRRAPRSPRGGGGGQRLG